jgi:hydroxyacylglutathione hydrolase
MRIEQIYTGCLSQAAYYIESEGTVAIVDPLRDVEKYIAMAAQDKANIQYVLETHFHADFVSGHRELAARTGATIVVGPGASPAFDAHIACDGERLELGALSIEVLHTPGHTMESVCYLLHDENNTPHALFSGDTLFLGDVGRPDLAQKIKADLNERLLAGYLYDSLRNKIMPLPDHLIVYPAHGAGSACGKQLSRERSGTLGVQKATNYALQPSLSREEFIEQVLEGQTPPPGYFPANVLLNVRGAQALDKVIADVKPMNIKAFATAMQSDDVLVLDVRPGIAYRKQHIPGSMFIGLEGTLATWVGTLIKDINQKILLVAEPGKEQEAITRLSRVGYDGCIGFLEGGMDAWVEAGQPVHVLRSIKAERLAVMALYEDVKILDVRRPKEFNAGHLINAVNTPLEDVHTLAATLDATQRYFVHCASGYRSLIFISILAAKGFEHLVDIVGGFAALKECGLFNLNEGEFQTELR